MHTALGIDNVKEQQNYMQKKVKSFIIFLNSLFTFYLNTTHLIIVGFRYHVWLAAGFKTMKSLL